MKQSLHSNTIENNKFSPYFLYKIQQNEGERNKSGGRRKQSCPSKAHDNVVDRKQTANDKKAGANNEISSTANAAWQNNSDERQIVSSV